ARIGNQSDTPGVRTGVRASPAHPDTGRRRNRNSCSTGYASSGSWRSYVGACSHDAGGNGYTGSAHRSGNGNADGAYHGSPGDAHLSNYRGNRSPSDTHSSSRNGWGPYAHGAFTRSGNDRYADRATPARPRSRDAHEPRAGSRGTGDLARRSFPRIG